MTKSSFVQDTKKRSGSPIEDLDLNHKAARSEGSHQSNIETHEIEDRNAKATQSDDAAVPIHLWDGFLLRGIDSAKKRNAARRLCLGSERSAIDGGWTT